MPPILRSPAPLPATKENADAATSLDSLYRAHAQTVARWAERLGGPGIDPTETIQEVFVVAGRRLGEFRGEARVTTWLFRITTRVLANQRRSRRRSGLWARLTRRLVEETPDRAADSALAIEEREATELFRRVLQGLPERYREVLVLFELEEMSTGEIARLLDRPAATIRVWLHRAREQFAASWQRSRREEDR
jgi:RNA polymerase sigma-70 factor (ECF subfamily)